MSWLTAITQPQNLFSSMQTYLRNSVSVQTCPRNCVFIEKPNFCQKEQNGLLRCSANCAMPPAPIFGQGLIVTITEANYCAHHWRKPAWKWLRVKDMGSKSISPTFFWRHLHPFYFYSFWGKKPILHLLLVPFKSRNTHFRFLWTALLHYESNHLITKRNTSVHWITFINPE